MYKSLGSDVLGVPEVKWFGTDNDKRIMVMQLLGPSLEVVFRSCNQHFSLATVLVIADELVSGLTNCWSHFENYLYNVALSFRIYTFTTHHSSRLKAGQYFVWPPSL
jgi:hypothetical protein